MIFNAEEIKKICIVTKKSKLRSILEILTFAMIKSATHMKTILDVNMVRGLTEEFRQEYMEQMKNQINQGNLLTMTGFVNNKMLNLLHNIDEDEMKSLNIENISINCQPINRFTLEMMTTVILRKRMKSVTLQYCNLTKDHVEFINQNLKEHVNVSFVI